MSIEFIDAEIKKECLFFQMESREDFSSLLSEYDLEQLVTAGTLLTPYLMQLENVTFVLKTLTTFTIVFIVSLLFVLYISNYVDIFVNRKRYAVKEILGFSHFRILKNRYIFLGIELIISGVLTVINYYFSCLFAIILIDYIFCELLYKVYISNALYKRKISKSFIDLLIIGTFPFAYIINSTLNLSNSIGLKFRKHFS